MTELQADMDIVHSIIIGIGVNVNQELSAFEESIQKTATSLKIENGEEIDRSLLVAKILYYLEKYGELYVENGFKPIKILWESHNCTIGKRIRATTLQETLEGVALGITNDGVLEIKLDSGEIRGVYSADIHLLGKN